MRRTAMRRWLGLLAALFVVGVAWFLVSDSSYVWPLRNTLHYQALRWWWGDGRPAVTGAGVLAGTVRDDTGAPVPGATVLVAEWDGTTYSAQSDARGDYRIEKVPAGRYVPVAGAPGYADAAVRAWGLPLAVVEGAERRLDVTLDVAPPEQASPGSDLVIGAPETVGCPTPIDSRAVRRSISFVSGMRPSQPTLFYTPITGTETLPTIIAVYPGPADSWECASIPLAQAGYAVIAAGPAYALDLEADIDELERLLLFLRGDAFARADGERVAIVAGSYSGLHVQRLLGREPGLRAALLLGPPTDLFDMRRRLEDGSFVPPFGLDQALVALGLPNRSPERYWRYSGVYHVRGDWPPIALLHSRSDDVVPFQQSELLAARLQASGVPHETHFFDGASHYLLGAEGQGEVEDTLEVYRIALDFLDRHLRHDE